MMKKPNLLALLCAVMLLSLPAGAFALESKASVSVNVAAQSALAAPQNFTANASKSNVTLTWDAVEGATQYKVYSCATKDGKYKLLKTLKSTSLVHRIKLGKKTRYYVVFAVSGKTIGAQSQVLAASIASSASTPTPTSAPALTIVPNAPTVTSVPSQPILQSPAATAAPTPTPAPSKSNAALDQAYASAVNAQYIISGLDQKYLDALNADRAANGVAPVQFRADLVKTAMIKAADMHASGVFYADHVSPTYGHPSDMGEKYLGYPLAENIMDASGPWQSNYADAADCARDQFMASPSHKATRLDKNLKYVGFAMYYDGNRLCICEHYSLK